MPYQLTTLPGNSTGPSGDIIPGIAAFLTANGWTQVDQNWSGSIARAFTHPTLFGGTALALFSADRTSSIVCHLGESFDAATHTLVRPARDAQPSGVAYDASGYFASYVPGTTNPVTTVIPTATSTWLAITNDDYFALHIDGFGFVLDNWTAMNPAGDTARGMSVLVTEASLAAPKQRATQLAPVTAAGSTSNLSTLNQATNYTTFGGADRVDALTNQKLLGLCPKLPTSALGVATSNGIIGVHDNVRVWAVNAWSIGDTVTAGGTTYALMPVSTSGAAVAVPRV